MDWLWVIVGAMVGAPVRYLVDRAIQRTHESPFPWGILVVNVVGSLILGLAAGGALAGAVTSPVFLIIGVGFCGALTTYSTFSAETVRLAQNGSRILAVVNVLASVLAALVAVFAGSALGQLIFAP